MDKRSLYVRRCSETGYSELTIDQSVILRFAAPQIELISGLRYPYRFLADKGAASVLLTAQELTDVFLQWIALAQAEIDIDIISTMFTATVRSGGEPT